MAKKLFYSLKEVSRRLGEPSSTIKYWEREFPHLKPHTTQGGTRQYTEQNIEALLAVQHLLRERQLTISGAREELRKRGGSIELRQRAIHQLEQALERLKALQRSLAKP